MDWVASIHQAIQYIEEHLREELTIREIAQQAALSPFYFQKGFAMLCGITAGDYIRQRRLSATGRSSISRWSSATIRRTASPRLLSDSTASHLPHCEKAEARSVPLLRFGLN